MASIALGLITMVGSAHPSIATHLSPVWRERADFLIVALLGDEDPKREQLWARRIGEHRFELCCIPFFAYDLALGDIVRTDHKYQVTGVVSPSGRIGFRVWLGDTEDNVRDSVVANLNSLANEVEWFSQNLMAIAVTDEDSAQILADELEQLEQAGLLAYETSRSA